MSKEQKKSLYSGTLIALTQEMYDEDHIVALRLHKEGRSYPVILFRDACYTQFGSDAVGKRIVWAREVTKEEVATNYPETWLIYKNSRDASADYAQELVDEMDGDAPMVLHHLNDGSKCLVQAKTMEILKKPPEKKEAWEYRLVPEVEQEDE